jgi:hypothetical protein
MMWRRWGNSIPSTAFAGCARLSRHLTKRRTFLSAMKILGRTIVAFSLVMLVSCRSGEIRKADRQGEPYRSLAVQKFGEVFETLPNTSGSAVLCVKASKPTQLQPQQQVAFFVYDLDTRSLLFEDSIPNGSVGWKDSVSVIVTLIPGTVKDEDKTPSARPGYIFDLRSRKTRELESADVR